MHKYEELLEVYQAQNALGIAASVHAAQLAPDTYQRAQQLLTTAQQLQASKADSARIIETAREAAQTAEDARLIATRKQQEIQIAHAQAQAAAAKQAQQQAMANAERARMEAAQAQAAQAQAQAEADRIARERAAANAPVEQARVIVVTPSATHPQQEPARQSTLRMRLLEQLNGPLPTRDTPRGLVATVPRSAFDGAALNASAMSQVARIATIVAANPGLRIEVEGNSDSQAGTPLSWKRAEAVRDVLVSRGLPPNAVTSRGLGNTRPLMSNATAAGREANDRVEIVVSGDPIGTLPFWDHTYPLKTGGY